MIIQDNNNDTLNVYADWLEDQGIDTKELRESIIVLCHNINSWYYEYLYSFVGGVGGSVGSGSDVGGIFGVGGVVGSVGSSGVGSGSDVGVDGVGGVGDVGGRGHN